jgi:hypothetical protein
LLEDVAVGRIFSPSLPIELKNAIQRVILRSSDLGSNDDIFSTITTLVEQTLQHWVAFPCMDDCMKDAWNCVLDSLYGRMRATLWQEQISPTLATLNGGICPGFEGVMASGMLRGVSQKISMALESIGPTGVKTDDMISELSSELVTALAALLLKEQYPAVIWKAIQCYKGKASVYVLNVSPVPFRDS